MHERVLLGRRLVLRSIAKTYADIPAVRDVSLDVAAGEFITLLGPSGSGKTTLLMMVAGFVQLDAGEILVGDQDLSMLPPHKRGLGVVFQSYLLFPHMSVEQNVAFPLSLRGLSKQEAKARVEEILALVGLSGFENRLPRQLSGGQQQRVALARALVYRPSVMLMDEPLGALDKKLREQMQVEIKAIQRQLGITVLYVTHDQDEALFMSDRVVIMNRGRIEQLGTSEELYSRPKSRFVAEFLGDANVLSGHIVSAGAANIAVDIGLKVPLQARSSLSNIGSRVTMIVRSSKIRPGDARGAKGFQVLGTGIVEDVARVRDQIRLRIGFPDAGLTLQVQQSSDSIPAACALRNSVNLSYHPSDVWVIPETEEIQ